MERMEAGLPEFLPRSKLLVPKGNQGPPPGPAGPAAQRGPSRPPAAARGPQRGGSRRGPAGAPGIDRALTPPVPSHPHKGLETTSANLEKQLFPGIQTTEGKGAGLGKWKSERDPDENLESGRAGRLGASSEEDPPRREGETQKPHRELWEERQEGIGRPSLSDPGP